MNGYITFPQLGRYGRFANQIFQIAGTIGVAFKNDLLPVFPQWCNHDHKERFASNEDVCIYQHMCHDLPIISEQEIQNTQGTYYENWGKFKNVEIPWGYHDIKLGKGNYALHGHMQSERYFRDCLQTVRHYMKMKAEPSKYENAVAIHFRKGDYDDKYHPVQNMAYYVLAMRHFSYNSKFLLFSDYSNFYAELCMRLIDFGMNAYIPNMAQVDLPYLESFALMKKCSNFIIGNSSYSAAAAILSEAENKKVCAPSRWFGPAYTNITAKDIYNKDWIVI